MMDNKYMNILKLENGNYFIYLSSDEDEAMIYKKYENELAYLQKTKPLYFENRVFEEEDQKNVNAYVRNYMLLYGIDNVRGGNYLDEILSENTIKDLNISFDKTKKDLQKFLQFSQLMGYFDNIQLRDRTFFINRSMLHSTEWIKDFLYNCDFSKKITKETITIYQETIQLFKHVTDLFFKIKEDIGYRPILFLQNPEYVFDTFFYDRIQGKNMNPMFELAIELTNTFEYMMYVIINYKDELEFDLSSYNVNYLDITKNCIEKIEKITSQ
jgi:hypothetical protein